MHAVQRENCARTRPVPIHIVVGLSAWIVSRPRGGTLMQDFIGFVRCIGQLELRWFRIPEANWIKGHYVFMKVIFVQSF